MRSLSDEMFKNFQVKRIEHIEVENQTSNFVTTNQIMEMLTDQYNDLQAEGFQVSAPDSVNLFAVEICKMDLQRIFDNLFSNIRKYADKAHSISVLVLSRLTRNSFPRLLKNPKYLIEQRNL